MSRQAQQGETIDMVDEATASAGDRRADDEGTPSKPGRRRVWWIVGAVAALVVLAIVLVFALTPRGPSAGSPTPSRSSTPSASPSSPTETTAPSDPTAAPTESAPPQTDPFPELAPVAPDQPGSAPGLEVVLAKFESVTGEAVGPGDVEAAAVRVTVDIRNTGGTPLDLNLIVMNAYMGPERDPAETYERPGGQPLSGSLEPGKTVQGVYLFRIPEDRRNDVTFVLDYMAGQPAITFRGDVP